MRGHFSLDASTHGNAQNEWQARDNEAATQWLEPGDYTATLAVTVRSGGLGPTSRDANGTVKCNSPLLMTQTFSQITGGPTEEHPEWLLWPVQYKPWLPMDQKMSTREGVALSPFETNGTQTMSGVVHVPAGYAASELLSCSLSVERYYVERTRVSILQRSGGGG